MSRYARLTTSQYAAIDVINQYAISRRLEAQTLLREIFQMANISWESYDEAKRNIQSHARVALHFHPDRPLSDRTSVAQSLLQQGIYKSQFETRISNGSVSAFPGGARDLWERNLFGGVYHTEGVMDHERPKYGALDLMLHPDGPSPRFGSCYLLLYPHVTSRCTFTYGGSQDDPKEKGTYEELDYILAAVFKDTFFREFALGEANLTPRTCINKLLIDLKRPFMDPSERTPKRNLDHFIEAQVHGDVLLRDDVEILVADPSFKETHTGEVLEQLCLQYSIQLYWHQGFTIRADEVPPDFRGVTMPSLAKRIAHNGDVNARIIGEAVHDLTCNPALWSDRGSYEDVLQELKYMWHILVRYGVTTANF